MNLLSEGNVVDAILQNLAGVAQEQEQLVETDIEDPEQAAEDRYLSILLHIVRASLL